MKTLRILGKPSIQVCLFIAAFIVATIAPHAQAGLTGPYAVDANTLHLWHLQDPGPTFAYDSVSNQNPQITGSITLSNTPGIDAFTPATDHYFSYMNTPGPSVSVYGSLGTNYGNYDAAIMTTSSACFYAPWTMYPGQPDSYPVYTNIANFVNTNSGAFTFEALVNFSVSPIAGSGPTPNILSGDNVNNEPGVARGWLWRLKFGSGAGTEQLEFNNIGVPNGGHSDLLANLPATGNDAPQVGSNFWYHVAIAYTGSAPTNGDPANMVTYYWTEFNAANTNAHILTNLYSAFCYSNASAAGMLNWTNAESLSTGLYPSNSLFGTPMLVLGGDGRGNISNNVADGVGWEGSICEVRISNCYRHSNEMMFNSSFFPQGPLPVIPASTLVGYGQILSVPATVSGSLPMSFQWYQVVNSVTNLLTGQTNQTLTISNATYAANGGYELFATNAYGSTNSNLGTVTVGATFQELFNTGCDTNNNPLDQTAPGSYDLHYSLTTDPDPNGVVPYAVVWGDQAPVGGTFTANGSSVWIGPEENAGAGSGTYTFNTTFQIDETSLASVPAGGVLTGTLWANGPGSETIPFYVNGVLTNLTLPANGETTPLGFQIAANLLQPGSNTLQIAVANGAGSPFAFRLQLTGLGYALTGVPAINNQPNNDVVNYGSPAAFSVVALGAPPLSYQWYSNGVAITGASARTLSFTATNFAPSETANGQFNANYQVAISNYQGSVTSSVAQLTINTGMSVIAAGQPIWSQATNIIVLYSVAVDPVTGAQTGNYSLSGGSGATVQSASVVASNEVVLTTSALTPGTGYTLTVQGVENTLGVVVSPSPTNIAVGIYPVTTVLWLKADTGVSTDGNGVNGWTDLSGRQNNLSSYGGSTEPQLATNSFLGRPVIRFNGTNETVLYALDSSSLEITNDISIFAVMEFADVTSSTNGMIVSKTQSNLPAPYDYYAGSGTVSLFRGNGTAKANVNAYKAPEAGAPQLVDVVMQGVNVAHRLEANTNGGGSLSTTIGDTGQALYLGTRADAHNRFTGDMAELILIGSALSTNDVASMENYFVTRYGLPTGTNAYAVLTQSPVTSTNVGQGSTLTLPAVATGSGPIWYQWFDIGNGTNIVTGTTNGGVLNATLTVPNVPADWNGDQLELTVTNQFGTTSVYVSLNVATGQPQILTEPQSTFFTEAGGIATNSVFAVGSYPLSYQWQFNGTNLNNNSQISGSQGTALAIADVQTAQAGNYQVIVANTYGSITSSIASLVVIGAQPIGFNGGTGWSANAARATSFTANMISSNVLELTDGNNSEGTSFFFDYPQYIGGFEASFTYQALPSQTPNGLADGITFCVQNATAGVSAIGAPGGDLAVNGITPSAEVEFNVYSPDGVGYMLETGGAVPGTYTSAAPVNLASGDPIGVSLSYLPGELFLSLTDSVAQTSFSTNLAVSIPTIVGGSTAYVGFTAATGGNNSIQTVSNFTFVSIPPESIQLNSGSSLISWPGAVQGYQLQESSNLLSGPWINVTNPPSVVNGTNQVTTPATSGDMFYRLMLQP